MSTLIYTDTLPGGKHWSMVMRRGTLLSLTDVDGGANCGMLLYNPTNLLERYNAPDTLKCQHTFKLTTGHCLYTDMGRVLCSIVEDTFGWHDTVSGNTTKVSVKRKWGEANYQTVRNDWYQNGYDSLLVEAAKYGMGRRDLVANVNWFSKVAVDANGGMMFDAAAAKAGASVALRFEMDTLVLFHTCPHPLNPAASYPRKAVRFDVSEAPPVAADDACLNSAPENGRGFENTRLFHACSCSAH